MEMNSLTFIEGASGNDTTSAAADSVTQSLPAENDDLNYALIFVIVGFILINFSVICTGYMYHRGLKRKYDMAGTQCSPEPNAHLTRSSQPNALQPDGVYSEINPAGLYETKPNVEKQDEEYYSEVNSHYYTTNKAEENSSYSKMYAPYSSLPAKGRLSSKLPSTIGSGPKSSLALEMAEAYTRPAFGENKVAPSLPLNDNSENYYENDYEEPEKKKKTKKSKKTKKTKKKKKRKRSAN